MDLTRPRGHTTVEYRCEHTKRVAPSLLTPHPKNPHKHPTSQVEALARSIERFGWRFPIVVSNQTGLIIAGHCRRAAAALLGCDAPVDCQDFESEADELAVLMADNIIPELAEYDGKLKLANIEELKLLDIELATLGVVEVDALPTPNVEEDGEPEIRGDELTPFRLFVSDSARAVVFKTLQNLRDELGDEHLYWNG